jgi:hypothetical protein
VNNKAKIGLLKIKMKRLHKDFIVSRETSIELRSKCTRALKASHPLEYKLLIGAWGRQMATTKKAKAKLKAVCDELRELTPAKKPYSIVIDGENKRIWLNEEEAADIVKNFTYNGYHLIGLNTFTNSRIVSNCST